MIFDFDLLTIAILFVIYIIVDIIVYIKNRDIIWIIFSFIAFVYLANVIKLTLFPFYIGISFPNNLAASVNIIPFKNCLNKTSVLNILMTIPYGIGVQFIYKFKSKRGLFASGACFSILIEMLQLVEALVQGGFSIRIIDINDVIFNSIGVVIGLLLLKLISLIFLKYENKDLNIFWQYVKQRATSIF
jgi:glycopeptide antibiotics resistance protein